MEYRSDDDKVASHGFCRHLQSIEVIIAGLPDRMHFVEFYRLDDYTSEEFDTLVKSTASPDAMELVSKVRQKYLSLQIYRNRGRLMVERHNRNPDRANFTTSFQAPDKLRWNYADDPKNYHPRSYGIGINGESVVSMSHYDDAPEEHEESGLAIAAMYGVSGSTSGNFPGLLMGENNVLTRLANLALLDCEELEGGITCHRIQGTDFGGGLNTWWIDTSELLIRRIESVDTTKLLSVITYEPETNVEIQPETLKFLPPKR